MADLELIKEIFEQRQERIQESMESGESPDKRRSPKQRLEDPALAKTVAKVRALMDDVPDVRADRVEEIKKQLKEGNLKFDSKSVADKFLKEAILNEML